MVAPVYPNAISIADIKAASGGTSNSLNSYYAGGGIIPSGTYSLKGGVRTAIPTSGTIGYNNFHGYPSPNSGRTNLANFWANRSALYRGNSIVNGGGAQTYLNTYYSDAYQDTNHWNSGNNYQNPCQISFGTAAAGIAPFYWTIILGVISTNTYGGKPYWFNLPTTWGNTWTTWEQQYAVGLVSTIIPSYGSSTPPVINCNFYWNNWNYGNNHGNSGMALALPGRWSRSVRYNAPTVKPPNSFTLGAGRLLYCGSPTTGYFNANFNCAPTGGNIAWHSNKWYETPGQWIHVNSTSSTITASNNGNWSVQLSDGYGGISRPYGSQATEFYCLDGD